MAMSTKQPDFETVMAEIGQFINTTVEGLELGTAHARSYYESRGTHLEPPLASMLTRSLAKEHIREKCGLTIEEFEQEDVALIGLRAKVQRYHVWIWKSPDEKIPNPGPSLYEKVVPRSGATLACARRPRFTRVQLGTDLEHDR